MEQCEISESWDFVNNFVFTIFGMRLYCRLFRRKLKLSEQQKVSPLSKYNLCHLFQHQIEARVLDACGREEFELFSSQILEQEEALEITARELQS